jgi:hypothetical protein
MDITLALGYCCYVLDTHMDQHRNPLVVFAYTLCPLLQCWLFGVRSGERQSPLVSELGGMGEGFKIGGAIRIVSYTQIPSAAVCQSCLPCYCERKQRVTKEV